MNRNLMKIEGIVAIERAATKPDRRNVQNISDKENPVRVMKW
jgi:hypothetical protein